MSDDVMKALVYAAKCARTLIYVLEAKSQDRAWKDNVLRLLDEALTQAGEPVVLLGTPASEYDREDD